MRLHRFFPFGRNKAIFAKTDEVLASCLSQCFAHKVGVPRTVILQKRALELFFVIVGGNVHGLHGQRVDTRVIHDGGRGARGGVEVLHLLGRIAVTL